MNNAANDLTTKRGRRKEMATAIVQLSGYLERTLTFKTPKLGGIGKGNGGKELGSGLFNGFPSTVLEFKPDPGVGGRRWEAEHRLEPAARAPRPGVPPAGLLRVLVT